MTIPETFETLSPKSPGIWKKTWIESTEGGVLLESCNPKQPYISSFWGAVLRNYNNIDFVQHVTLDLG